MMIECDFCEKLTPISHNIKFFINKEKKLTLGGSDFDGPLCQSCWHNIVDHALGYPETLKKEDVERAIVMTTDQKQND